MADVARLGQHCHLLVGLLGGRGNCNLAGDAMKLKIVVLKGNPNGSLVLNDFGQPFVRLETLDGTIISRSVKQDLAVEIKDIVNAHDGLVTALHEIAEAAPQPNAYWQPCPQCSHLIHVAREALFAAGETT